jgi:hypothetical protein
MNHHDRGDHDVFQRRRRRGVYAAVLSAAAGAALAAAMIPAAPAFADPADDAVGAAGICVVSCAELAALDLLVVADGGTPDDEAAINTVFTDFPSSNGATAEETFLVTHPLDLQPVVAFDTNAFNFPLADTPLGIDFIAALDAGAFDLDQLFPGLAF